MESGFQDVTRLLHRAAEGDPVASEDLFASIYPSLRALAHRQLRAHRDGTLCTTDLVHEASLKLIGNGSLVPMEDRRHLLAVASRAMRQVMVDYARRRLADKRGGGQRPLPLDDCRIPVNDLPEQILALDDALDRLRTVDERCFNVVELRFFGGLSAVEIAGHLGISDATVRRDWRRSRAFLHAELAPA